MSGGSGTIAAMSARPNAEPATLQIAVDDPHAPDVHALLERHLAFAHRHSPPEDVHAFEGDALAESDVTFFSCRRRNELLGVGALKHLDDAHAEIKSMHTAEAARGRGVARAVLRHVLQVARDRGYDRVSLETGFMAAFAPARALYASAGFTACGPFADYRPSPHSAFFTLQLTPVR